MNIVHLFSLIKTKHFFRNILRNKLPSECVFMSFKAFFFLLDVRVTPNNGAKDSLNYLQLIWLKKHR